MNDPVTNKLDFKAGLDANIIKTAQSLLNFSYDLVDSHMAWGTKSAVNNSEWNGIIGLLHKNVSLIIVYNL